MAAARSLEQANEVLDRFLMEYNAKFARPARRTDLAYRKLDRRLDLDYIFSLRYQRTVNADHTIAAPGAIVQLPRLSGGRGYPGKKVEVCQQPNGELRIYLQQRLLHVQPATGSVPIRTQPMRRQPSRPKKKSIRIYRYGGRSTRSAAF